MRHVVSPKNHPRRVPRRGVVITILCVLSAGIALSASWVGWSWSGAERTDLAQWLMAATSLITLLAAIAAGAYAAGAFKLESTREERWQSSQRRAQASLVAAWAEPIRLSTVVIDTPDGPAHDLVADTVRVRVRNASDVPVTDVVIWVDMAVRQYRNPLRRWTFGIQELGVLPPNDEAQVVTMIDEPSLTRPTFAADLDGLTFTACPSLGFTDAAGVSWFRHHDGELTEQPKPYGLSADS